MWIIIDRIKNKTLAMYRNQVFKKKINSSSKKINILGKVYVNATNIHLGENVTIYPNVTFWGDGEIVIGDNVDIGKDTIIYAKKRVYIGSNTIIAAQCYIIDSNHGVKRDIIIQKQPMEFDSDGVEIGEDVWIGAGCKVIKGAKIEDGAVIGAMSLVNKKVKANKIAVGIPAREVKERS